MLVSEGAPGRAMSAQPAIRAERRRPAAVAFGDLRASLLVVVISAIAGNGMPIAIASTVAAEAAPEAPSETATAEAMSAEAVTAKPVAAEAVAAEAMAAVAKPTKTMGLRRGGDGSRRQRADREGGGEESGFQIDGAHESDFLSCPVAMIGLPICRDGRGKGSLDARIAPARMRGQGSSSSALAILSTLPDRYAAIVRIPAMNGWL